MTVDEFLYQAADSLRKGAFLDPEPLHVALENCRDILEAMVLSTEDNPSPQGLEAIDLALTEACEFLAEGLDLLELAVADDIPELASEILERAQDGRETLREVRRQAENHVQVLAEEMGPRL